MDTDMLDASYGCTTVLNTIYDEINLIIVGRARIKKAHRPAIVRSSIRLIFTFRDRRSCAISNIQSDPHPVACRRNFLHSSLLVIPKRSFRCRLPSLGLQDLRLVSFVVTMGSRWIVVVSISKHRILRRGSLVILLGRVIHFH